MKWVFWFRSATSIGTMSLDRNPIQSKFNIIYQLDSWATMLCFILLGITGGEIDEEGEGEKCVRMYINVSMVSKKFANQIPAFLTIVTTVHVPSTRHNYINLAFLSISVSFLSTLGACITSEHLYLCRLLRHVYFFSKKELPLSLFIHLSLLLRID